MITSLREKIIKARKLGVGNTVKGLLKKVFFRVMRLVFRFDHWHGKRPFETTNYKKIVVTLSKKIPSIHTVVDIGCGLGDILVRIPAKQKIGFDIDDSALRAARILRRYAKPSITFFHGSLGDYSREHQGDIDLVILTNWFHGMTDDFLKRELENFFSRNNVRYVIVDEIRTQPGRIEKLFNQYATIEIVENDWQDSKKIFLFKVINS